MSGLKVAVEGVSLDIKQWGPADATAPILMLHEGLGSIGLWRDFPARLAALTGRQVIAWSRQGYGWSETTNQIFEPDFMQVEARCIAPLMDVIGIERADIFGHSDGASIALLFAAEHPDRVASLILEAPHIFVEPMTTAAITSFGQGFAQSDMAARMAKYHADPVAMFWRWHDIWVDPRFVDWTIEACLPTISAPTLLIQGHDDEYGSFAQLDRIAAVLPDVQQLRLAACGHSPHRDQPDQVLQATGAFLRAIIPGDRRSISREE